MTIRCAAAGAALLIVLIGGLILLIKPPIVAHVSLSGTAPWTDLRSDLVSPRRLMAARRPLLYGTYVTREAVKILVDPRGNPCYIKTQLLLNSVLSLDDFFKMYLNTMCSYYPKSYRLGTRYQGTCYNFSTNNITVLVKCMYL